MLPRLFDAAFKRWADVGVPTSIPWYATEYGYSPYAAEAEVDLPGALLDADFIGHFLTVGGSGLYFYGIEPNTPIREVSTCENYGNLAVLRSDDDRKVIAPYAAYWVAKLLTSEWSTTGNGRVYVYSATSTLPSVTTYMAKRADGSLSVMLINKSATDTVHADVDALGFRPSKAFQYSRKNYVWHAAGENGYASPNRPPDEWAVDGKTDIVLPPYSLTIVR